MYSNNLALRDTWSTRGAERYHLALHDGWLHRNRSRGTSLGGGSRAPSIPTRIPETSSVQLRGETRSGFITNAPLLHL